MEKVNVVLVCLRKNSLSSALNDLHLDHIVLKAIVLEGSGHGTILVNHMPVPAYSFSCIDKILEASNENDFWLLYGEQRGVGDVWKMAKFLQVNGIARDRIFNVSFVISREFVGNLRWLKENTVDFFATGISYMEVGLELSCIYGRGINLACSSSDIRQNMNTAKYAFQCLPQGSCKFVLIGLAPYSFHYDIRESLAVSPRDVQFSVALEGISDNTENQKAKFLQYLLGDNVKQYINSITAESADPNYNTTKEALEKPLSATGLEDWEVELKNQTKKLFPDVFQRNVALLDEYTALCRANKAVPVAVVWPFAPILREHYPSEILVPFREILHQMAKNRSLVLVDLFDLPLPYDCFYQLAHLNARGRCTASRLLNDCLCKSGILSKR